MHRTRIPKAGDFGLVMIHALSHIKVDKDNLSNDGDPRFVAEFYNNLKILSQDLFKRSAAAVATVSTSNTTTGGNNTATADAIGSVGESLGPPRTMPMLGGLSRGMSGMLARQGSMRVGGDSNSSSAGPSMRSMLTRQQSIGSTLTSVLNVGGGAGAGQGNGSVDGSDANRSAKRASIGGISEDYSTEGMLGRMKRYAQAAGGQVCA